MPIIKSAIKRMKQNEVRRDRNRHYGSHMKSMIKRLLGLVDKGQMDEAKTVFPEVVSAIDTAAKKRIIHANNAAHKKSRVQRALNVGPAKKEDKPVKVEKVGKKEVKKAVKAPTKKAAKTVKKEEKKARKAGVKKSWLHLCYVVRAAVQDGI